MLLRTFSYGRASAMLLVLLILSGCAQLPLINKSSKETTATPQPSAFIEELTVDKTFIGTIACETKRQACKPTHVVVSLYRDGVWRMRTQQSGQTDNAQAQQGCWHQIGSKPNRILLETARQTVLADLTFVNGATLKINVFNYMQPKLEAHLSRQPDIDPISELRNQTGPLCRDAS